MRSNGILIWPKYSSRPSILTRRSMASLIDSSRPLWTLTTYHCLLLGAGGGVPSWPSAAVSAGVPLSCSWPVAGGVSGGVAAAGGCGSGVGC